MSEKYSFWDKKTFVTYLLSVLVFLIHISTFANYSYDTTVGATIISIVEKFLTKVITPVAVPLFFIISGALFYRNYNNDKYMQKIKSRLKTLVIPYFLWNILNMVFCIITSYTFVQKYFIGREKFVITLTNVLKAVFLYDCNKQFWFIFCLIVFALAAPVIYFFIKNRYVGIITIIVLIILDYLNIGLSERVFFSIDSIIYYIVGAFIGKHYFSLFSEKSDKKKAFFGVGLLMIAFTVESIYVYNSLEMIKLVKIPFLIVYSYALWTTVDLFIDKIKIRAFMKHSFFVYAMHVNVSAIITKFLWILLPKNYVFAVPNFIITLVCTLFLIELSCCILQKFLPNIYTLLSGDRC